MVKGLRIKVSSNELKTALLEKAAYHGTRRDEKQVQLPQLKSILEKVRSGAAVSQAQLAKNSTYGFNEDAVERLETDIANHNNKAIAFTYLAEHLYDDDYDLDESDLVRLDILKRW